MLILSLNLPVRYHPRRHIFDKLIYRYIGLSVSSIDREKDIELFEELMEIYTQGVSSWKRLFNPVYNTYKIDSIDPAIQQILYSEIHFSQKPYGNIFILDDLESFKKPPKQY